MSAYKGDDAPENPEVGAFWIDTSGFPVVKRWDGGVWVTLTERELGWLDAADHLWSKGHPAAANSIRKAVREGRTTT